MASWFETRTALSIHPDDITGRACSHAPDSLVVTAKSLAWAMSSGALLQGESHNLPFKLQYDKSGF